MMIREIIFRGKRIDNGEWVYGYYSACVEPGDNGGVEHLYRETTTALHYISDIEGNSYLVDPATVGQFTGLHDKEGREIYEGDIVKFNLPKEPYWAVERNQTPIGRVMYEPDHGGYIVMFREHGFRQPYVHFNCDISFECEVVGNIHENPELLESGVKP